MGCVQGAPNATIANRFGLLDNDRKHILNLSGAKTFELTERQTLTFGTWFTYRTGKPWGLRPTAVVRAPNGTATIPTTRYLEARDANELDEVYALNLDRRLGVPDRGPGRRQRPRRGGERHRPAGAARGEPRDRPADPGAPVVPEAARDAVRDRAQFLAVRRHGAATSHRSLRGRAARPARFTFARRDPFRAPR